MNRLVTFFLLLCMLILGACKEDYVYPDAVTEFCEVKTGPNGKPALLLTDYDQSFTISESPEDYQLKADTTYRALSIYQRLGEGSQNIRIYSIYSVFSPIPVPASNLGGEVKTDSVDIQSMWMSERYLNMILLIQVKNHRHSLNFIDQGIQIHPDGSRTLRFLLHHDREKDYEAFTQKFYASIPLWAYALQKGDKVQLELNTYKEGKIIKEFNY